jgi:tripartite-type tricarboxylate transporter receptor subunit TctC
VGNRDTHGSKAIKGDIMISLKGACVFVAAGLAALPISARAADFYAGKQMILIIGADTGGGYDAQGRLMARHLGQFIPGHPNIVVQNMPAAGSLVAANTLYTISPKDGTTIGFVQRGILTAKITNPSGVHYEVDKFNWIGNLSSETGVVVAWHTSKVKTAADLFKREFIVGGNGPNIDTETTPRLLNALAGTKFKIVSGYKGTTDIVLAMERGEVEGLGDWSWSNIQTRKPDYLRDHKIVILAQSALEKAPDLPNVPLVLDFAKNDTDRKVMELFFSQKTAARPVLLPPGVPADRVALLRSAFMKMAADPQFKKDAEKSKLEISPSSGESVEKVVKLIASASPEMIERLKSALAVHN